MGKPKSKPVVVVEGPVGPAFFEEFVCSLKRESPRTTVQGS